MNTSVPLPILLIVLASAAVLWFLYRFVRALEQSAERTKETADTLAAAFVGAEAALKACTAATDQLREALAPAAGELRSNMQAIPKLMEGIGRIATAQLEILQAQRAEHEEKKKNPFGKPNAPAPPKDVTGANMEYEVTTMMRAEGISREEALLRMNGANDASVWSGNSVFEGWR
jgi:hypothetical protein